MAKILYSGQILPISGEVDLDQLTAVVLETCANGAHSWISLPNAQSNGNSIELLVGPGIPFAVLDNKLCGEPSIADIPHVT